MATLVGGDGDGVGVFFDGAFDDFVHAAVVAEVDDLCAFCLHDAAHDIDGGVVTVEQRCCGNDPHAWRQR